MSFNPADMISLSNYEEYFILYTDNELDAAGKLMVESFVAQHLRLEEELEILLSTKLPLDNVSFEGKAELLSPAMKLNTMDESLLLYIDDELPNAKRKIVEEKINTDKDYALQHSLLMQAKLASKEVVSYPNKKELHRHERKVVPFGMWMRIAAAVIVLLSGSLFYLRTNNKASQVNNGQETARRTEVKITPPGVHPSMPVQQRLQQNNSLKEESFAQKERSTSPRQTKPLIIKEQDEQQDIAVVDEHPLSNKGREVVRLNTSHLTTETTVDISRVNKTFPCTSVTSKVDSSYNKQNSTTNNPEVDWAVETTEKKTPARGFFRKVSRFIERKAGIGTANADNELLIGSVALKLK